MFSHQLEIDRWIESEKSSLIQPDACFQKRQIRTRDNYAGVDKLLAVHFWYDANHSVVIPELIGHESPPQRSGEARRDASSGNRRKLVSCPPSTLLEQGQQFVLLPHR